jgi:hypothetical protein
VDEIISIFDDDNFKNTFTQIQEVVDKIADKTTEIKN